MRPLKLLHSWGMLTLRHPTSMDVTKPQQSRFPWLRILEFCVRTWSLQTATGKGDCHPMIGNGKARRERLHQFRVDHFTQPPRRPLISCEGSRLIQVTSYRMQLSWESGGPKLIPSWVRVSRVAKRRNTPEAVVASFNARIESRAQMLRP